MRGGTSLRLDLRAYARQFAERHETVRVVQCSHCGRSIGWRPLVVLYSMMGWRFRLAGRFLRWTCAEADA